MISLAQPLPIGNAIRLLLSPDSSVWRLLRKDVASFTGFDDPDAYVVRDGGFELAVVDDFFLNNGQSYFYCLFSLVSGVWRASDVRMVVPSASYDELTWDALSVLRDRLDYGLSEEVQRGKLNHEYGRIPVLTAPPQFEDTVFPLVTVHLTSETPVERALGEEVMVDFEVDGESIDSYEGWLARSQITVMGWCLNPDERIALRQALRRVVIGNLPVFEGAGMTQVEFQMQDSEDFQSYNAPIYQCMGSFSCTVPVAVSGRYARVQTLVSTLKIE